MGVAATLPELSEWTLLNFEKFCVYKDLSDADILKSQYNSARA